MTLGESNPPPTDPSSLDGNGSHHSKSALPPTTGAPSHDSLLRELASLDTPVGADERLTPNDLVSDWSGEGPTQSPAAVDDRQWVGRAIGVAGRYQILAILGRGGMGNVYLAVDHNRNDTKVAIKVPSPRLLEETPSIRERFVREFAALIELEHPHICRITDTGTFEQVPFMVLQHLGGGHLKHKYFRSEINDEPRTVAHLFHWLRPIAIALDFVHARGFLHRDVKPENILFDEHGNAYLSDFGIVRVLNQQSPSDADVRLTRCERWVGTPGYIAPEVGSGRVVDGRADLYALAAVVYFYLTGRPPFAGKDEEAVRTAQLADRPVRADELNSNVSPAAAELLDRALSLDPDDRPGDCFAFATELERSCTGSADSDQELARLIRPRRRRLWGMIAVAVVGLCVILWLAWNGDDSPAPAATRQAEAGPDDQGIGQELPADDDPAEEETEVPVEVFGEDDVEPAAVGSQNVEPRVEPQPPKSLDPMAERLTRDAAKYLESGEADDALQAVNQAIEIDDSRAAYFALRARICTALELTNHAMDQWTRAIELEPDAEYFAERGLARLSQDDFQGAHQDFTRAIERNDAEPRYYVYRGLAWLTQDDPAKAVVEYTQAIDRATAEVPPAELAAWRNQRGMAYLKLDRLDSAIVDATCAIELQPNEPAHYRNRAAAYRRRGGTDDQHAARADDSRAQRLRSMHR